MKQNPIRHAVIVVARMGALVYIGLLLYLGGCQRRLIYLPSRAAEADLQAVATHAGFEPWRNADQSIIGWRAGTNEPSADTDAMIVFHGNAGHALHRLYFARGLGQPPGNPAFIVYLFEYPGYGARPGRPGKPRILAAASEALQLAAAAHPQGRVFLTGESLGSGVAAHLAGQYPDLAAGLFLATPFTSLADVAKHHYPYLPVRTFLRDRYENVAALRDYRGPVAIMIAERDTVVPAHFGQTLHDGYRGPKRIWIQRDRDHNHLDYSPAAPWWLDLSAFLKAETESTTATTGSP